MNELPWKGKSLSDYDLNIMQVAQELLKKKNMICFRKPAVELGTISPDHGVSGFLPC